MKDLTKGSNLKNLVILSLPIMFSNFMHTVYNLTDAFWLGKLENSTEAVSVVGIAFPVVFFLSSFGAGFTVAGSSIFSNLKGQNNSKEFKSYTGQLLLIFILFSTIFFLSAIFFIDPILSVLNTPTEILNYTKEYLQIVVIGMVCMYLFIFYQSISLGLGDSISPMRIQLISIIINLLLDPLLIFGFRNIPAMGILGAGYATLIARLVSMLLSIIVFSKKYNFMTPGLKDILPNRKYLLNILKISIPESISRSMTSFGFFILQGFVNSFGTSIISVYSIGLRVTSIFMMPAFGISSALTSIVGQNLGAKQLDRVDKSIKLAFILINSIMFLGCLSLILFGGEIVSAFISNKEVIYYSARMYRITPYATFMFGMIFVYNGIFNAAGYTKYNLILSLLRLWLLRIPATFILSKFIEPYSHESLWWAMIISNSLNLLGAYILFKNGKWRISAIK